MSTDDNQSKFPTESSMSPRPYRSPRILLLLTLALVTSLIGLVSFEKSIEPASTPTNVAKSPIMTSQPPAPANHATTSRSSAGSSLPNCPDGPFFTTMPMQSTDFLAFRPLGFVSPPIHVFPAKHANFSVTPPGEATYRHFPVVFPGDMFVTSINTTEWIGQDKTGYQLYFQPCQDFKAYFYHLGDLAPDIKAALATIADPQCRQYPAGKGVDVKLCQYQTMLPIKAGDLAGYSGDAAGVDFGAVDYRVLPLGFANPSDYSQEMFQYVSPISYFTTAVQAQFLAKLGSYDGTVLRTKEPRLGEIAQDKAGTAQGNWFTPGQTWAMMPTPDPAPFLALVHDYVGPEPIFSIGTAIDNVKAGLYSFPVAVTGTINRDFGDVTADGNIYCYERFSAGQSTGKMNLGQIDGILILQLIDAGTLKIEKLSTSSMRCTTTHLAFTEKATLYRR